MADEEAEVTLPEVQAEPAETEVVIDAKKAPKAPKETKEKVVTADEGIDDLKQQVERAKADAAERLQAKDRQIQEAFKRAQEAEREVVTVKKDAVGSVIDSLTKDQETAERDYVAAMEAGDFKAAAKAQTRISNAAAEIVAAKRGQMELEEQAKKPLQQPVAQINDPVDQLASTLSPKSAAWIRNHPEFARDPRKTRQMVRAHEDAIDEGHSPDSDVYFNFVETRLGIGRQEPKAETGGRDVSRAPISAPVGRDLTQAPDSQRPGVVKLTASQVRAARETLQPLYPDKTDAELLQIYASNMQALVKEGKIGRAQ
jgi:hypothetical protein